MAGPTLSALSVLALCLVAMPDATARQAGHALLARGLFTPRPAPSATTKPALFSPKAPQQTVAAAPSSPVVATYFDDWTGTDLNTYPYYSGFTEQSYFVGVTTADPGYIAFVGMDNEYAYMKQWVQKVHASGKKALLSIGGWSGSVYFSDHVANPSKRSVLAGAISKLIWDYKFDGITLDWEYPNNSGAGNHYQPADSANLLLFLQALRNMVGNNVLLTMDVALGGLQGADGNPLNDASGFANVLNYITLMDYDISGSWTSTTGPNGPLYTRGATAEQAAGADTGVKYWASVGMPKNKLVLGLPAYGKMFTLYSDTLDTTWNNGWSSQAYQSFDVNSGVPVLTYKNLIDQKYINPDGSPVSNSGFTRYWDNASQTPFLFNKRTKQFIVYDDPQSFTAKAQWAKQNGLAGVKTFDAQGLAPSLVQALRSVYN